MGGDCNFPATSDPGRVSWRKASGLRNAGLPCAATCCILHLGGRSSPSRTRGIPWRSSEIRRISRAGLLFIGLGIAAIAVGSKYNLGTAARMGPGYFPRILGLLLLLLGAIITLRGLRGHGERVPPWKWRPTLVVLLSVVAFGLIMAKVGLAISTVLSDRGGERGQPRVPSQGSPHCRRVAGGAFGRRLRRRAACAAADLARVLPLNGASMDLLSHLALGFGVALSPINLRVCAGRRADRHADRRAARHRPRRDIAMLLPTTLCAAAGVGASSCSPASTTARSTAAPRPPSCSTCRARRRRS